MKLIRFSLLASILILSGGAFQTVDGQESPQGSTGFEPTFDPFFWLQIGAHIDLGDEESNSLILPKARFGANGKVTEAFSYHFMLAGTASGAEEAEEREMKLLQTFMRYKFSDRTSMRLGQFKYPFGIGTYPAFTTWDFNHPAFISGGIARDLVHRDEETGSGLFRDLGIEIASSLVYDSGFKVGYKLMVMNGNGILKKDDNSDKDLVGRVSLSSPKSTGIGTWTLGSSFYRGTLHLIKDPLLFPDGEDHDEEAYGVDFRWDLHENNLRVATVQAEIITAKTEAGEHDVLSDGEVSPAGFYVQGTYFTSADFYWALRYDEFDHDSNAEGDDSRDRTTIGACYYIDGQKNRHRINANYEMHNDPDHGSEDLIIVGVTLVF
ncbi:MAG: porin [Planctomycetota bacterium]|nr:porin [Planctomycetota bacterium]